jgi:hypothetical protein
MFVEGGRAEIPMHGLEVFETELVDAERAVMYATLLHGMFSPCAAHFTQSFICGRST